MLCSRVIREDANTMISNTNDNAKDNGLTKMFRSVLDLIGILAIKCALTEHEIPLYARQFAETWPY